MQECVGVSEKSFLYVLQFRRRGEFVNVQFLSVFLKFFFLLTPFFVLSSFLSMTAEDSELNRKKIAVKVTFSVIIISFILLFIGKELFNLFGITLNSFRIGTGVLLFLSAKRLVDGIDTGKIEKKYEDVSVVPLAIPITVGPATTGALLVMGYELKTVQDKIVGFSALTVAILVVGVMLYLSGAIERIIKKQGINILSKITGLILAALSAQMVMVGILGFMEKT